MDAHDTGLALFGIIYFTIAMLTSKGLHAYKLWDNKDRVIIIGMM